MLRHEDVAEDVELMLAAESLKCPLDGCIRFVCVEEWEAAVTAEGDEVIVTFRLAALEPARHGVTVARSSVDPTHAR